MSIPTTSKPAFAYPTAAPPAPQNRSSSLGLLILSSVRGGCGDQDEDQKPAYRCGTIYRHAAKASVPRDVPATSDGSNRRRTCPPGTSCLFLWVGRTGSQERT